MEYSARMLSKVKNLRRKYADSMDTKNNDILNSLVWYSFPIVYSNYLVDARKALLKLQAVKQRRKRYRKYVCDMITTFEGKTAYLVSLTFTDECLSSTSAETRQRYVRNYLNSVSLDYFACIDFGKQNNREHYHAIIITDRELISEKHRKKVFYKFNNIIDQWTYGFYSLRAIHTEDKDIYKTMNYACKSSDYAFKSADEDNGIKPFHKRGVKHWHEIRDLTYEQLPF